MSIEDDDFAYHHGDGSKQRLGALIVLVSAICTTGALIYGVYWLWQAIR